MSDEFHPNSTDAVLSRTISTLERVEARLDEGDARFKEIEKDVESLKRSKWFVMGVASVLGFIAERIGEWFAGSGGPPGKH